MEYTKYCAIFMAVFTIFCFSNASTLEPAVSIADDGTVTIELDNNRIGEISDALSKAFAVRVCAEDFGVIRAGNTAIAERSPEAGGPLREGNEPVVSGVYTSDSLEEILDAVTAPSPYTWLKTNACYVIYPREGSLLMEKISVTIPPLSLFDVLCTILASRLDKTSKDEPISVAFMSIGGPKPDATNVDTVQTLTFVDTPLMEALCWAVEAVDPSAGDGLFIWQLCSGAAHEYRNLNPRWIACGDPD